MAVSPSCCVLVGIFSCQKSMFGGKQTLMLHLFITTKNGLLSTFTRALCVTFCLGLTCYPPPLQCTSLLGVLGGNSTRISGSKPLGTQEKRLVPALRSEPCLARQIRENLSATSNYCWYTRNLASLVTGPHTVGISPVRPHETQEKRLVPALRSGPRLARQIRENLSATSNYCCYTRDLASLVTGPHTFGIFPVRPHETQEKRLVPALSSEPRLARQIRENLSVTSNYCWYTRDLASLVIGPHTVGIFPVRPHETLDLLNAS